MEVQVSSKKLIKPAIPTPSHLQNMNISFMDQIRSPGRTVPIIFYYASNIGNRHHTDSVEHVDQRQKLLKKSLSEILTLYYPIAGRYIKENHSINCNDEGVEYVEALVNGQLSQILQGETEPNKLNRFVPDEVEESAATPLAAIQTNIFNCGGLAIGCRFSHRTVDGFTFGMFINGWAKACKVGNINDVIVPNFESGNLFPPRDLSKYQLQSLPKSISQVVTKRFVFDLKKISNLKADQAATRLNRKPSTNVVLIALIWRAQINAARARYGRLMSSQLLVFMSLRGDKKLKKIPENCCGNIITLITTRFDRAKESKIWGLNEFVDHVNGATRNSIMEYAKVAEGPDDNEDDEFFSKVIMKPQIEICEGIRKGDGDVHLISSIRNMPFYETDFGWGKPAWVSLAHRSYKGVFLMEGRDSDTVDVWVTMDVEEMAYFQKDPSIVLLSIEHGMIRPKM